MSQYALIIASRHCKGTMGIVITVATHSNVDLMEAIAWSTRDGEESCKQRKEESNRTTTIL